MERNQGTRFRYSKKTVRHLIPTLCLWLVVVFVVAADVHAGTSSYFYDDVGRLTRVIQGSSGVIYDYDEVGNLNSTTSTTISGGVPIITAIAPNVLFLGSKMLVRITGQNLLSAESVTCSGRKVSIIVKETTDTQLTTEMTALSAGEETIMVTTRSGAVATTGVKLTSSKFSLTPGQLALAPGTTGSLTATISPAISVPVTINIHSNAPLVATIPPSVTIPSTGKASFIVTALQPGVATIDAGAPNAVVLVAKPFIGDVGDKVLTRSTNISVMIDSIPGTSPTTASQVSVAVDSPYGAVPIALLPVSVIIDPLGASVSVSRGVSVKIQ